MRHAQTSILVGLIRKQGDYVLGILLEIALPPQKINGFSPWITLMDWIGNDEIPNKFFCRINTNCTAVSVPEHSQMDIAYRHLSTFIFVYHELNAA